MKIIAVFLGVIGILAFLFGVGLLFTFPLMWAINYVFASSVLLALFGTAQITFWKTYVLSIVTMFLFKSFSTSSSSK